MGWRLQSKPKTLKVTKTLAKEFAEMDPAPQDRPLSQRRLDTYKKLFDQELFRPCTWAKAYCPETNGTYRVNGKHTSTLLNSMEDIPEFFVTVEDYVCEKLEDVARLYSTFDSRQQSFAGTVPQLSEVPVAVINASVSGIAYHLYGAGMYNKQAAEKAELLLEHPEFVLWATDTISQKCPKLSKEEARKSGKILCRFAVLAAMFGTWKKSQSDATKFWSDVRDQTGSKPSLPDRKLAVFLMTTGIRSGLGAKRINTADAREFYVKCIHAWNAWRRGETTDLKYYSDKPIPSIK